MNREPAQQKTRLTETWIPADKQPPRFGQYVLYRTEQYQALGCYERPGVWLFADGDPERNTVRLWQPVN
jgi:hypothetical protein